MDRSTVQAPGGLDASNALRRYRDLPVRSPRAAARHAALSVLAAGSRLSGRLSAGLARPRVQFLYLHYVFPDEEEGFRKLLDAVATNHRFISYSEAVDRVLEGRIDDRYVTFSFDDGLASCLRAGEILDEYGAKACFFVCPPLIGESRFEVIARFCQQQLAMPPTEFLHWSHLEQLVAMGHEVGSHTMTHRNLADLSPSELSMELGRSREEIERRLGPVRHFAWPFGRFRHMSRAAAEAVFEAGYQSCTSAERGCHVQAALEPRQALCLRRDLVVAAWPLSHSLYFMAESARKANGASNLWPETLAPRVAFR